MHLFKPLTDVQTIQFRMNGVGMVRGYLIGNNKEFFKPNYSSTTDSNVYILTANILVKSTQFQINPPIRRPTKNVI